MFLYGVHDPVKRPRSNGKAKWEELENKNSEGRTLANYECEKFVDLPLERNLMERVRDVGRACPKDAGNSLGDGLHCFHLEFWNY